jgi:adenylate cyclase
MTQEGFKRKLTAILSADVKGYSRLMGEDEESTVRTITAYRNAIFTLIKDHRGRVVDSPGDNILAEFVSIIDALRCAWDIQQEINSRNAVLPENSRMNFRIGVNLGDIIENEGRIYGDGVNIAARLEGLAEHGGISISGTAYDQAKNKLPFQYEYQGQKTVKNIKDPVRVYRIVMESEAAGDESQYKRTGRLRKAAWTVIAILIVGAIAVIYSLNLHPPSPPTLAVPEKTSVPNLSEKPSIAVLPFANLSDDMEQEYFSDGITNDIITDISKFHELFVIASNTVFTYKNKPVDIKEVGFELGVRYVLEGSVQKGSDKLRINVQLIDASTGGHIWAERFDRNLNELFALQDEIVQKIVATLAIKIESVEGARAMRKDTESLKAYDYVLRGGEYLRGRTRASNIKAEEMFTNAIEVDPSYAFAYVGLGQMYVSLVEFGWTEFPDQALQKGHDLAQKALNIDSSLDSAHRLLGYVYMYHGQHELAIIELERAIELNPNDAMSLGLLGMVMLWSSKADEAIEAFETMLRFDPRISPGIHMMLGLAYYLTGQYDAAIRATERGLVRHSDFVGNYITLAAAYAQAGRSEQAASAAVKVLELNPLFELDTYGTGFRNPADRTAIIEGLRKAGLK